MSSSIGLGGIVERNQLVDLLTSLALDSQAAATIRVGQRVFVRGLLSAGALLNPQSGTVRHIGPVHWREKQDGGHQGSEICGVELDSPVLNMRGTGNGGEGTVDNVTYFITAKPRSAVFVRPSDVTLIDPPLLSSNVVIEEQDDQVKKIVIDGDFITNKVEAVAPVDTNLLVGKGLTGSLWSRSRQVQNQQLQSNPPSLRSTTSGDSNTLLSRSIPAASSEASSNSTLITTKAIVSNSESLLTSDIIESTVSTTENKLDIEESVPSSPPLANQRTFSPLQAFDPSSLILRVSEAIAAPNLSDDKNGMTLSERSQSNSASTPAVTVTVAKKSSTTTAATSVNLSRKAPPPPHSKKSTTAAHSSSTSQSLLLSKQTQVKAPSISKPNAPFSEPADVVVVPSNRRGISYGFSSGGTKATNSKATPLLTSSSTSSSGMRTYILTRGADVAQTSSNGTESELLSSSSPSTTARVGGRASSTPPGGKPIFKTMIGRSSSVPPSPPSPSLESSERDARAKEKEQEKLAAKVFAASRTETSSPPKQSSPPKSSLTIPPTIATTGPSFVTQETKRTILSSSVMTSMAPTLRSTARAQSPRAQSARASSPRAFGRSSSPRFTYDRPSLVSSVPPTTERLGVNPQDSAVPNEPSMTRRASLASSTKSTGRIVAKTTTSTDFPPSYRSLRRKSISTPIQPTPYTSTDINESVREDVAVNLSEAQVLSGKLSPLTPSRRASLPQPLPTEGLIDPAMTERAYRGLGNFGRLLPFELGSDLPTAVWQSNLRGNSVQNSTSDSSRSLGEPKLPTSSSPSKGSATKSSSSIGVTFSQVESSDLISQTQDTVTKNISSRSVSPSSTSPSRARVIENYSGPKLSTAQFLRLSKADSLVSVVPSPTKTSTLLTSSSVTASSANGTSLTIEDAHVVISRVAESLSNRRNELMKKLELQRKNEEEEEKEKERLLAARNRDNEETLLSTNPLSALEKLVRTTIADVFDETKSSAVLSLSPPQISGTAKKAQKGLMSITPVHGRAASPGGIRLSSSPSKTLGIGHGRAVEIVTDKRILLSPRKPQSPTAAAAAAAGKHARSLSHGPLLSRPLSPPPAPTPRRALRLTKKEEQELQLSKPIRQSPSSSVNKSTLILQTSPQQLVSPVPIIPSIPVSASIVSSSVSEPIQLSDLSQASTYAVRMYAGICEMGYNESTPNKPCQDAIVMQEHTESDSCMLAVFDGHGDYGHLIAEYMRDHLPALVFNHTAFKSFVRKPDNIEPPPMSSEAANIMSERAKLMKDRVTSFPALPSYAKGEREIELRRDVETALKDSLKKCEMQLLLNNTIDCNLSGCTACVVVICGNQVTVANVGDSRATLLRVPPKGSKGGPLLPAILTIDHKPSLPGETKRILLAGGRVKAVSYEDGQDGPVRVWCNDQDLPGLSMSRSICDVLGKKAGVSSAPDFYTYTLAPEDAYIVIASDGLWEFINAVDVADVVAATALEAHEEMTAYIASGGENSGKEPPLEHIQLALDRLADAATRRFLAQEGYADDVSIILAEIVKRT